MSRSTNPDRRTGSTSRIRRGAAQAAVLAVLATGVCAATSSAAVFSPEIRPDVFENAVSDCDITVGPVHDHWHPGDDSFHKLGGARVNCRSQKEAIRVSATLEWRYVGETAGRQIGSGYSELPDTKGWGSRITMTTAACGTGFEWRSSANVQINSGAWVKKYSRWTYDGGRGAAAGCPPASHR